MVLLILILIHSHESGKRKEPPVIGGGGGGSSFQPLIHAFTHAFSHGQLRSPLEMVRLLAGYGFDEQINDNGYKRKVSKLNQTSLSTARGTLYRIRGKLRIFVNFHLYVSALGHKKR